MKHQGNVLLGIMLLLTGLMTVAIALSSAVLSTSIKIQRQYKSLRALTISEAGLNKGLWKVNVPDLTYGTAPGGILETDLTGGEYRVEISDCPAPETNCKYIKSTGYVPTYANPEATRVVRVKINKATSTSNVSFKFGVQVDNFGTYISNNAKINGSVFSSGPVQMSNNSQITGNVISYGKTIFTSWIYGSGKIIGDAKAWLISGVNVTGTKTQGSYPPDQDMPIKTAELNTTIDAWETEAANGSVHIGNLTTTGSSNKLGPIKIDGNWTISNNAEVEIMGTIWVTGNITVGNNAKIFLTPSYGNSSGIIIADHKTDRSDSNFGTITVRQGSKISGIDKNNPKTPSYIMMFSTESPPNPWDWLLQFFVHAITIEQGSVGGVFYAPFGSLHLQQNAQARAIATAGLLIDQNAIVDYDGGLANSSFAGGPAGPWTITEWLILD